MVKTPKDIKEKIELVFKVAMLKKLYKPRIPVEIFEKEERWARPELAKLYEDTAKRIETVVKNILPFIEKIIEAYKVNFPKKIVLMSSFEYLGEVEPEYENIVEEYEDCYGLYSKTSQTIYLNMTAFFRFRNIAQHILTELVNWGKIKQEEVEEGAVLVTDLMTIEILLHEVFHHIYNIKCPSTEEHEEEFDIGFFTNYYRLPVLYAYVDCNDAQFKKYLWYEVLVEAKRQPLSKELEYYLTVAKEELERIFAGDVEDIC